MTKGEAIEKMLRVLDEATLNGIPTPTDQIADLRERAAYALGDVVQFLAGVFRIPAVHSVVRIPTENLLGDVFFMKGFQPTEVYSVKGEAKSFYIETSGNVTITFTQNGEVIKILTSSSEEFTAHKGNLEAQGVVTMVVTSAYPYIVKNPALYPCAFETDEKVPHFIPFVPYDMPEDFREFEGIYQSSDCIHFREYPDARRLGHKTFLLPYHARGQFDFRYWRNAESVPCDAPDDTVLEVEEKASVLVPLKLARDLTVGNDETLALSYWLDNRFNTELINIRTEDKGGRDPIQTIYGVDW